MWRFDLVEFAVELNFIEMRRDEGDSPESLQGVHAGQSKPRREYIISVDSDDVCGCVQLQSRPGRIFDAAVNGWDVRRKNFVHAAAAHGLPDNGQIWSPRVQLDQPATRFHLVLEAWNTS